MDYKKLALNAIAKLIKKFIDSNNTSISRSIWLLAASEKSILAQYMFLLTYTLEKAYHRKKG